MNTSVHLGTALITHATSRIGATYADRLARRGYDLILADRHLEHLNALARRITDETGRSVETLVADLGDTMQVAGVERVLRSDASLTMLVIHLGVRSTTTVLHSEDEWSALQSPEANIMARLSRVVATAFASRGAGTIIGVRSSGPVPTCGALVGNVASPPASIRSIDREFAVQGCCVQQVVLIAGCAECQDVAESCAHGFARSTGDVVEAALYGLDQGERVTVLRHQ